MRLDLGIQTKVDCVLDYIRRSIKIYSGKEEVGYCINMLGEVDFYIYYSKFECANDKEYGIRFLSYNNKELKVESSDIVKSYLTNKQIKEIEKNLLQL